MIGNSLIKNLARANSRSIKIAQSNNLFSTMGLKDCTHLYLNNQMGMLRMFGNFENRSKDENFSYLEYFEEKEMKKSKKLSPMSFSTATNHKQNLNKQPAEVKSTRGYSSYTPTETTRNPNSSNLQTEQQTIESQQTFGRIADRDTDLYKKNNADTSKTEEKKEKPENEDISYLMAKKTILNHLGSQITTATLVSNFLFGLESQVFWTLLLSGIAMSGIQSNSANFALLLFLCYCGFMCFQLVMEDPNPDKLEVLEKMIIKKKDEEKDEKKK